MKKEVFDELHDDLSSEKLNLELEINSIKKAGAMDANPKTDLLMQKTTNPSRHRKLLVKKLVKEVDLLRDEMFSIERKFLKHEIKESVFRKLMKEKENKLIRKESQIIEIVNEK